MRPVESAIPRYMAGVVKPHAASPSGATAISPPFPPRAPMSARVRAEPDAIGELVGGDGADEIFPRAGCRHGRRAVVGVGPGADQRRIADPAPALGGEAASRGRRRDMAVDVDRDGSDGAVFDRIVEPAFCEEFLELSPALRDFEPAVRDLLDAVLAREQIGILAGQEDVRSLIEQEARETDRRSCRPEARDRSCAAFAALHDGGVELDASRRGEHASASRIEAAVLLEHPHRRLHGVERALAFLEDRGPGRQRRFQTGARRFLIIGGEARRTHRSRTAVNHQPPPCLAHARGHSERLAGAPVDETRRSI